MHYKVQIQLMRKNLIIFLSHLSPHCLRINTWFSIQRAAVICRWVGCCECKDAMSSVTRWLYSVVQNAGTNIIWRASCGTWILNFHFKMQNIEILLCKITSTIHLKKKKEKSVLVFHYIFILTSITVPWFKKTL